jgi:hypothetical protein
MSGFKTFQNEQTFTFPTEGERLRPGLYLLTGENRREPRLQGNGVGKSTIGDALCWLCYGRTARGVKASGVVNWNKKKARVTGTFIDPAGASHVLERTQSPNGLLLDDHPITQEEADSFLGLDQASFLNTVLLGQFNPFFFDLPPAEKLNLFSSALSLDAWVARSDRAKDRTYALRTREKDLEVVLSGLTGRLAALQKELEKAREQEGVFERERKERVDRADSYLALLVGQEDEALKGLRTREKALARVVEEREAKEKELDLLRRQVEEQRKRTGAVQVKVSEAQFRVDQGKRTLEAFADLGASCPRCRQKVTAAHKKQEEAEMQKEARAARAILEEHTDSLRKELVKEDQLTERLGLVERGEVDLAEVQKEREVAERKSELRVIQSQLTGARKTLALAQDDANPYREGEARLVRDAQTCLREQRQKERDLDLLRRQLAATELWVKEFKSLRLWLIDENVEQLEVEVNNCLGQLGLVGWEFRADVERETKSGGMNKGFSVFIRSPGSKDWAPWEAWSGGESQRLRIASGMGFANLVRSCRGLSWPLELWDEPTAHLSGTGVSDLLDWLRVRAEEEQRQIWLIDHRSLDAPFDGRVSVIGEEGGSRIELVD